MESHQDLTKRAQRALFAADEALADAALEHGFLEATFGKPLAQSYAVVLESSRAELMRAFAKADALAKASDSNPAKWAEVTSSIDRAVRTVQQQSAGIAELRKYAANPTKFLEKAERQLARYAARRHQLEKASKRLESAASPWELDQIDVAILDGSLCLADARQFYQRAQAELAKGNANQMAVEFQHLERILANGKAHFRHAETLVASASERLVKPVPQPQIVIEKSQPIPTPSAPPKETAEVEPEPFVPDLSPNAEAAATSDSDRCCCGCIVVYVVFAALLILMVLVL